MKKKKSGNLLCAPCISIIWRGGGWVLYSDIMNEGWDRNTFFTNIYIYLYFFSKGSKLAERERESGGERRTRTQTGGRLLY